MMFEHKPYSKSEQLKGHQKEKDKPKITKKIIKQSKPKKRYSNQPNIKPSMRQRKKFPKEVVEKAIEKWNGLCANCQIARPDDPHHIRRKSDNGKGVLTNCLPVCRPCHDEIEEDVELRQWWKEWAKKEHGYDYWMDQWDKESMKYEQYRREGAVSGD